MIPGTGRRPVDKTEKGDVAMAIDINSMLLFIIAVELALVYVRLGKR